MAIVVIFGLLVATFLTLVVVPVFYFLIERSKEIFVAGREEFERKRMEAYLVLAGEEKVQINGK
jgi:predicted RND superfamily exporter protein